MRDESSVPRATVLIADDAAHARRLCAMLLRRHGFRVLETDTGTRAVRLYRAHRPDVVVLDIGMPGDGLAALKAIKDFHPTARAIMLTARRDEETVKTALATGAGDYVVKPFSNGRLLAAVERLLQS